MEILSSSIISVGIFLFLYLTWRNLRDDYRDDLLISYSWLVLLAAVLGGRIVYGLVNWGVWNDNLGSWFQLWQKPGFNTVGALSGVLLVTGLYCQRSSWKLWSFFEDMTPIFYLSGLFLVIGNLVKTGFSWRILEYVLVILGGYLLARAMKNKYRSLFWYKSGKKGFIFFFVNLMVSLLMAGVSFVYKDRWILIILYLTISLISVGQLFILGEVFNNFIIKKKNNGNNNP